MEPPASSGEGLIDRKRLLAEPGDRRTVFLMNLPTNTTVREVRNLFCFARGFVKVQLYTPNKPGRDGEPLIGAFALFDSNAAAVAALDALKGYEFDEEEGKELELRLAVKNLHIKNEDAKTHLRKKPRLQPTQYSGSSPYPPYPSSHSSSFAPYDAYPEPYPYEPPPPPLPSSSHYHSSYSSPPSSYSPPPSASSSAFSSSSSSWSGPRVHPPGTTLFVSDMRNVTDEEFLGYVTQFEGYTNHKIGTDKKHLRVAWVEFDTVKLASEAMAKISGYRGLIATYSKNPLNKRR